jgi:hypothetical protein
MDDTEKKRQYCPLCFKPMIPDENIEDIYVCFELHLNGKPCYIDLQLRE